MTDRFYEDDRVVDVETGTLGTVVGATLICGSVFQRAYLVRWDGAEVDLRRADTIRAATVTEDSQQ